jgi:hypothetical protein
MYDPEVKISVSPKINGNSSINNRRRRENVNLTGNDNSTDTSKSYGRLAKMVGSEF